MRDTKTTWRDSAFLLSRGGLGLYQCADFARISHKYFDTPQEALAAWNNGYTRPAWVAFSAECQKTLDALYQKRVGWHMAFNEYAAICASMGDRLESYEQELAGILGGAS